MTLDPTIREQLVLPAICAPMFLVTGPDLVREACKAGIVGALPRANARSLEMFEGWLKSIRQDLDAYRGENPDTRIGPIAVNLASSLPEDELKANLELCGRYGVEIIINAMGNPTEMAKQIHDWGGKIFHDVTSLKFAEKAIAAGVDGLTCIGSGGGGHSGGVGHLVLVPKIREIFDGTIIMAGSVSTGAAIRAAEILGADMAYMGTRFIATQEADVDPAYREMIVESASSDLMFTGKVAGVPANWMVKSMERVGLDPENLPTPLGRGMRHDHLPPGVTPWKNLWSAGQGIDLINDIPTVAELVIRLRAEYVAACDLPNMADVARLVDQAQNLTNRQ
jgi:nitronate monooxygenase